MRAIVAILFVSAVLSASAVDPVHDLINGFVNGLNNTALTRDILALHNLTDLVQADLSNVVNSVESGDIDQIATAIQIAAQDIHMTTLWTHDLLSVVENILQKFVAAGHNLTESVVLNNFMNNYNQAEQDFAAARNGVNSSDYNVVGLAVADLLKIVVFGNSSIPAISMRGVRQLSEEVSINNTDIINIALDTIISIQGFLEQANTTVNVSDYENLVNDGTYAAILSQPVVNDIKAENISAILADAKVFYEQLEVVLADVTAVKNGVAQWIVRDAPLFENHNRLVVAVESLLTNWGVTMQNVQKIEAAYNQTDYEGTGKAVAGLYNQFYSALIQ